MSLQDSIKPADDSQQVDQRSSQDRNGDAAPETRLPSGDNGCATEPRPAAAHIDDEAAAHIPDTLKAIPRCVVWRWAWKRAKGRGKAKWTKPPIDPETGF